MSALTSKKCFTWFYLLLAKGLGEVQLILDRDPLEDNAALVRLFPAPELVFYGACRGSSMLHCK